MKKLINKLDIPYYKVAKEVLINRYGLSEEGAITKIQTLSFNNLELEVEAINIISPAIQEMQTLFSEHGIETLRKEIYEGKEQEDGVLEEVSGALEDIGKDKKDFVLDILERINYFNNYKGKYAPGYVPLELKGWDEVKKTLAIIRPLMEDCGIEIEIYKVQLQELYDKRVEELFLTNEEGLDSLLKIISQNPNSVDYRYVLTKLIEARRKTIVEKSEDEKENIEEIKISLENWQELREEDLEKLTEEQLSTINEEIMGIEQDVEKKLENAKRKNSLIENILNRAKAIDKMNKEFEELRNKREDTDHRDDFGE